MADAKLTALTAASALAAADLFYVSQSAASRQATGSQLLALVGTAYVPLAGGTMTGALTIASGTLTASAPALSITQTWNQGATAFIGALIDITNTASSSASRAIDVRIAGASIFSVRPDGYAIASVGLFVGSGGTNGLWDSVGPHVKSTGAYSWAQSANATDTSDLFLYRDAAATLAQRNGTNAQTLRVYGTYTSASVYERLSLTHTATTGSTIAVETLGATANLDLTLTPAGTGKVKVTSGGLSLLGADVTLTVGASGTSRLTFTGSGAVVNKTASTDLYFGEASDTGVYIFRGVNAKISTSGANAQTISLLQLSELTTIAAAATTDTTIQMPAGAIIFGVTARVTVAVTCTTNFNIGDSGSATRFGTNISKAATTTNVGSVAPYLNASALSVRITPDSTPSDNTGRVRITIYYFLMTAATS